ncbi:MAG: glycosyltransferase [Pseudomonadota bacterium]
MAEGASVCVIIAAYRAEATIGRAVASALSQPEVSEVVVVDDASPDATGQRAKAADDGTGRLRVLRMPQNSGPAAARNHALDVSSAPLVAVLDADDFLLPGRFAVLLAMGAFDLAADNIVFVNAASVADLQRADLPSFPPGIEVIDAAAFAAGNLARPGVQRGELGFLKPLMSRDFLDRHALRYDPGLWLGEDYDLYMRMLLAGGRFGVTRKVGYAAVVRAGSLSGQHRTADLLALTQASDRHLGASKRIPGARAWIRRHRNATRAKYLLRAFLDRKAVGGMAAGLRFALVPPTRFMPILRGVLRDKLVTRHVAPATSVARRFLFEADAVTPR